MPYEVDLTPQARKDFLSLDKSVARHVALKIERLGQNADTIIHIPLKGFLKGKFKLRAGDWRVVYSIEHEARVITIFAVRHRSEIYRI